VTARILVVDDEPDLEDLVVQKFRRQVKAGEFAFRFARDGVEALALLAGPAEIDLVVTDLNMPRMDGLTLLARLQEHEERLATVVVSAYGDMANIRTAMNRGAFDFLTKPIDFADFEATVTKTLRHVAAGRESQRRRATAEKAHATLARYFSPNLAEELAADAGTFDVTARRIELSSLFTDVAGFTRLAESVDPSVLAPLLNRYLAGMTDVVFAHGGTVAKIIGDALHVLFGAPRPQDDHAGRAVACALALDAFAEAFRRDAAGDGTTFGPTRIGVHAGPALVGNFGGARFFDYTAYGDTINVAARLERLNKQLGTRVCVSSAVVERAPGFRGRPVGDVILRGRNEPIRVFEPIGDPADGGSAKDYLAAFGRLEASDASALPAFAALVGARADDPLASFHLRRLLNGGSGVRIQME
jgi:adenylate cyclase